MTIQANGRVGIGTTTPSYALDVTGDTHTTGYFRSPNGTIQTSDIRFKKNIEPIENALDKILSLRGVTYDWRRDEFPGRKFNDKHQMGVIAQEIEKQFPEAVITDANDGYKSVNYSSLVAPLIEGMKALYTRVMGIENQQTSQAAHQATQDREIASVKAENAQLKVKNAELEARLNRLEKALSGK